MSKQDRERKVLLGLVEYYIQTGKPVGSNTLKDAGFENLSSATIRNYFAKLEETGYLSQTHSSAGRIPTYSAYRTYTQYHLDQTPPNSPEDPFQHLRSFNSREISAFLQEAAESLGQITQCAVLLSSPRFDHDMIIDIKLVSLDAYRCLCILITDFGVIHTEVLRLTEKLSSFAIKRIESYFHWRLTGIGKKPEQLEPKEEIIGQKTYNELMLRYIVGYSNFIDEDLYRTGFSNLLKYPDLQDTKLLASALSLFENRQTMRLLLKECMALDQLKCWIGDDLDRHIANFNCSVLAIPYNIHHTPVGAVGLLGPTRIPYRQLFQTLHLFSNCISEVLTRNIYKFKISFRQPEAGNVYLKSNEQKWIGQARPILLEDRRERNIW